MTFLLDDMVRAVRRPGRPRGPECLMCHRPIGPNEEALRFRAGTWVHRRCATYRIRNAARDGGRLGHPR